MTERKAFLNLLRTGMVTALGLLACAQDPAVLRINGGVISLEFDSRCWSRVVSMVGGKGVLLGDFSPSETIEVNGTRINDFELVKHSRRTMADAIGEGVEYLIECSAPGVRKDIIIASYDDFPALLAFKVSYTNTGTAPLEVGRWTNNSYGFRTAGSDAGDIPFWSYQPGSYGWENDWVQPLHKGFERQNYMGMNWEDYGGGTPVADLWRRDGGVMVGHLEMVPKLVSLPVGMPSDTAATLAVTYAYDTPETLEPGESISTLRTFVAVHQGDLFRPMSEYSRFMVRQGIEFTEPPEGAYESIWCGWGYERDFTIEQFMNTLPKVQELGLEWAVLDYGWSTGEGDSRPVPSKFPRGDESMRTLVADIHATGAKAKLWWSPLNVQPNTDLYKDHQDYLLLNEDGTPRRIEFWRGFFLCPANEEVQKATRDFVVKAIRDWGWDGLKIDGNHLNGVPPCYNPAHNHAYPEESVEQLPAFFKMIFETARSINPEVVVEICPCGQTYSFFTLPYMNQSVASDPQNSWQIRLKGKALRALAGSKVTFFGDHVELSDEKQDFASTVGIGGIIGTKFVWPVGVHMNRESGDVSLTPEKEAIWTKWIDIYKEKMLPEGTYRGELYDIGYDRPEAHAVEKDGSMYYAFYAPSFKGEVELRGLDRRGYRVTDYVNDVDFGTVHGPTAKLRTAFNKYLLIEVTPE